MSMTIRLLAPLCALGYGLATSAPAAAELRMEANHANAAAACQLSIPTTDTKVRAKASGFRNESTTNSAFVICGYNLSTADSEAKVLYIGFTTMDGAARTINCTAVTGTAGIEPLQYSSKSVPSAVGGSDATSMIWQPEDFGGTDYIPYSNSTSVTCTLPPQTAITSIYDTYRLEIGS